MQVSAATLILCLAVGQITAIEISKNCLNGKTDASDCCKGVPYDQDVLLRNPNDCHTFFQCVHEKPMLRVCAADLHWSVEANRCEWPDKAGCQGIVKPTSAPVETTSVSGEVTHAPPTGVCKKGETSAEECCKGVPYWQDVLLPNPEDCGSYIQCVHEKPMVRPCPDGLHWSIEANRCEWPNLANCNSGTEAGGSNENDNGEASNENSEESDESDSSDSSSDESTDNIKRGRSQGVSDSCLKGETSAKKCCNDVPYFVDAVLKNPTDCGSYYQCIRGKPVLKFCPGNLHWSVELHRCDSPEIAKC